LSVANDMSSDTTEFNERKDWTVSTTPARLRTKTPTITSATTAMIVLLSTPVTTPIKAHVSTLNSHAGDMYTGGR
jgi:hypothetical protein